MVSFGQKRILFEMTWFTVTQTIVATLVFTWLFTELASGWSPLIYMTCTWADPE